MINRGDKVLGDAGVEPVSDHTHVEADVTDLGTYILAAGVTYENLSTNSDIGTGATQVSQGDHIHEADVQPNAGAVTVGGSETARTFTVTVRKWDGVVITDQVFLVHWWLSASAYGVPALVAGSPTPSVSTGLSIKTLSGTDINSAVTDGTGVLVVTVSTSHDSDAVAQHFQCEIQGHVYTANGTVFTTTA